MNATATPAKVARIGASRPRVYEHGDDGDNRSAKGNTPMFLAAVCAVAFPLLLVSVVALVGYLVKN
jgi:hypothetical protein